MNTENGAIETVEVREGEISIRVDSLVNDDVKISTSKWVLVRNMIGSIRLLKSKWSIKMEVEALRCLPNVSIRRLQERDLHDSTTGPSIFDVPDKVELVPIGPYHPPSLRENAFINVGKKWICAKYLIEYFNLNLSRCLARIESEEGKIRSYYAQDLDSVYAGELFKELFFLDSCFIWFFIYISSYDYRYPITNERTNSVDLVLLQNIMDQHVLPDITSNENRIKIELLMLRNQVPWFLIEIISDSLDNTKIFPLRSAFICFENLYPRLCKYIDEDEFQWAALEGLFPPGSFHHLLHIYHWSLVPTAQYQGRSIDSRHRTQMGLLSKVHVGVHNVFYFFASRINRARFICFSRRIKKTRSSDTSSLSFSPRKNRNLFFPTKNDKNNEESIELMKLETSMCVPNAIELHESSISFRRLRGSFDIIFRPGIIWPSAIMQISALHIFDYSSTLFKQLINFEQKYPMCGFRITGYMTCVVRLLQTKEDINLLKKNNILPNTMKNDKEILNFVQKMRAETRGARVPRDLKTFYRRVTIYHARKLNRAYGGFKHHYCPNPWITLSVFGGVTLFILTLLQTIYTILAYKKT